uniref:E3 ubiquitin-protein ligase Topors n=1 Tax=Anopheles minimus TaxID=112268 RepID=A0A182WL93_9DIPT
MEEAPIVDCPPTPEILPLSSTPPPRTDVGFTSSSEDGDEPTDGRRSPPPKCAICLGKCRQRAYTNSCKHQFCFRCLLEWSKVKPECPLCKQRFFSIVYYKSIDCFEQHTVAVPSANVPRVSTRNMYHELNLFLTNSQRFTAYAIPNMTLRLQPNNERLQELLLHQSSEVDRFIREYGNQPIPTRQDELRWRQFIYANRLYACPLPDLNGRFRETSAGFYRDNPAQMHRVLSWMHRDLLVLSTNIAIHAPNMNVLEDLLQTHDIDSREFLLRILRHMPLEDGEHFQHECVNFARSPYDMIGYDRCVQYNPRFAQRRVRSQVIISSSEEDDDIVYLPGPTAGTSSNPEAPVIEVDTGGEGASNGNNNGVTGTGSNSTATSGTINPSSGRDIEFRSLADSVGSEEVRPVATSGTLPRIPLTSTVSSSVEVSENILLSSSDSDDCQFVMAQKPPHLRTPDHVVDLESASDSDVVFVAEEPLEIRATTRTTRQQQQGNSMKKETAGIQEYNNGASTSSGYCGGGNGGGGSSGSVASGSALRTKYYVRPRSTRYSGGMGVKSIYEASDTDDSDSDTLFNLPQGRRTLSNTANDSSSHDEVDFGSAQRKRRRPNKKTTNTTTTTLPKGSSKRTSRKRRHSSVSSSSSNDCSESNSSSTNNSDEESNTSSSNSSCSSSSSESSSNSSSRSSSSSSSYGYGASGATTLHRNVTVEIECGRQLRRNTTAQQCRTTISTRSLPGLTDSKTRTRKKRSKRTIEKGSKRSKEKTATSASKSKSRHAKSKKKSQTVSRTARDVAKDSRKKSKSSARGVAARSSKTKKRTKPSSDLDDVRSTSRLDEDILEDNTSTQAHYVIASRPSVSPTLDVTTVDGTECRERKLKSVIIKRCHYNKLSSRRSNDAADGDEAMPSGSVASVAAVPDSPAEPSTSTSLGGNHGFLEGEHYAKMEPFDVKDELKHEPATNDMQLSFSSSSSSDSEPDAPNDSDWTNSRMYSAVAGLVQMHRNSLFHPSVMEQQQHQQLVQHNQQNAQPHWQQPVEYIPEPPQLPINGNDQQHHTQTLAGNDALPDVDGSNTGASESIFEPTLSWSETGRPLIPEDRGLSSAAASPFSSISFPPSTTSVSPSPSMSSQSLALAVAASPLELIESLGTMDGDSPLPSSVLSIDAIDGAMEELMANGVDSAIATLVEAPI